MAPPSNDCEISVPAACQFTWDPPGWHCNLIGPEGLTPSADRCMPGYHAVVDTTGVIDDFEGKYCTM